MDKRRSLFCLEFKTELPYADDAEITQRAQKRNSGFFCVLCVRRLDVYFGKLPCTPSTR